MPRLTGNTSDTTLDALRRWLIRFGVFTRTDQSGELEDAASVAAGELLYGAADRLDGFDRLPIGDEGDVLTVTSGLPAWGAAAAGGGGDGLRVDFFWSATAIVATNMPAADQEFPVGGSSRIYRRAVDLSACTEGRLCLIQNAAASATTALARLQYASAIGGAYADLDVERAMHNLGDANGTHLVGSWSSLAALGRDAVFLRVMLSDGNGTADPSFYAIYAEFR